MKPVNKYRDYATFRDELQYLWKTHKSFLLKHGSDIGVLNTKLYSQYKLTQSNEIKWDIVIVNIPLIFEIVHNKWTDRFDFCDLLQEGLLGGSMGVEKYQEDKGSSLPTMIRTYSFKKITEYIDTYFHSVIVFPDYAVKKINKLKKDPNFCSDPITHLSSKERVNGYLPLHELGMKDNVPIETVWEFAESNFDIMSMDIFLSYFKKGPYSGVQFTDCCKSYNLTKEKAVQIANSVHDTIKQKYYGIYENTI